MGCDDFGVKVIGGGDGKRRYDRQDSLSM